jgi:trimeric autotransporter adhesin
MSGGRLAGIASIGRGTPALVVAGLMSVAALAAGPGSAAAAAHPGGATAVAHPGGAAARDRTAPPPGTIMTIAGGRGGPAKATSVAVQPNGVAFAHGNLYIADSGASNGGVVRKVSATTDRLTTPVGTGVAGAFGRDGDGGPARAADFISLSGTAVDQSGNLVLADWTLARIRVVAAKTGRFYGRAMTAGNIYTVAGGGSLGYRVSGVPATQATLTSPNDVTVDHHGNLVIADSSIQISQSKIVASVIQVVAVTSGRFYGRNMVAGDIYTVAGYRKGGFGFSGDGGPATKAQLNGVVGSVRVDHAGNLVLADGGNNRIRVVAAKTGRFYGQAMTVGDIYTVVGGGTGGLGDGGPATSATLSDPSNAGVDAAGNLVIIDTDHNRVRVVATKTGRFYGQAMTVGHIYAVAGDGTRGFSGDGGPAASAEFSFGFLSGLALDAAGNLLLADAGRVRVVAAKTGTFYGRAMTAMDVYTVAGNGKTTSGVGGLATRAEISEPTGLTVDAAGNKAFTGSAQLQLVADSTRTFYGQAMTAGHLYTVAGNGTPGFSGDGGRGTKAELRFPSGTAADAQGNLVVADSGNNRVRVVAGSSGTFYGQPVTAGHIYTVAGNGTGGFSGDGDLATKAELDHPDGVALDPARNLLIADGFNGRVRAVASRTGTFYGQAMTAGHIYTIAGGGTGGLGDGGPATSAEISGPAGLALDPAGNLLIADGFDGRVRAVASRTGTFYGQPMTAGHIYTVAGGGTGGLGDGGPATSAELSDPLDVKVDGAGNLLIADTENNRVRVVAAKAGTFYGKAMTVGHIYTVAGNGGRFGLGDGGPATRAELYGPSAVAASAAGNLLIADTDHNRVRKVTG